MKVTKKVSIDVYPDFGKLKKLKHLMVTDFTHSCRSALSATKEIEIYKGVVNLKRRTLVKTNGAGWSIWLAYAQR
ncbi:hypothetical protein SDC9_53313 [bioreactor metagenome]|uniref:Uncharacterized protein n=1 Tax=bioreactor metagenome TaxID=1076179 RepID=A0A644WTG1_9ZZZZ|nr:MAG: hypothetical protein A2W94_01580 [Bacteroidetes bacterium GWE2_42_42]HBG69920.1 hypothetical protein [Bacteroidales bacterium]HCB62654.1 hypothetical protein [Bacteroidales bacterium]HCY23774.1 hypothetical protein [Bacteroidales bacterium]